MALLAIGGGAYRATDVSAAFPFGETFQGATAPGFELGGAAALTAEPGGSDLPGSGWLRLTPNVNNQFGYAYNRTAFPSAQGISYEFDYAAWGGSGADGLAFVLFDGATQDADFHAGPPGGALGYTRCFMEGAWRDGLTNAYMALGFDVFGNFASTGVCQQTGLPGMQPNRITIRGGAPDYQYRHSVAAIGGVATLNRAGARTVTVTIVPSGGGTAVSASVRHPNGTVQTIASDVQIPATPPSTLKFGFTASTGGFNNHHEIRGMRVAKPTDLQVSVVPDAPFAARSGEQGYTATITNAGPNPATGVDLTATMPRTDDIAWTCTATDATCPAASGTGLPTTGGAMAVDGVLTFRITGTLDATADDSTLTLSAAPSGDTSEMAPDDNQDDAQIDVTPVIDAAPTFVLGANGLATATSGGIGRGGNLTRGWQWYRCEADGSDCGEIPGATSITYQTTSADRDANLRVRETLTNGAGSAYGESDVWTLPNTTIAPQPPTATRLPIALQFTSTLSGSTFECRLDDATVWTACASPLTVTGLSDGSHTMRVRAVFGGLSDTTPATHTWTVDTTTSVSIVSPAAGPTSNPSPTVLMTGEPGASWTLSQDGTPADSGTFDRDGNARSTAVGTLADGSRVLRVDVEDAVGNVAYTGVTLIVDTQDPVAPTVGTGPPAATSETDAEVTFDVEPGTRAECRFDDGPWLPCTSPWTGGPLPDGGHVLEVRAVDAAGNHGKVIRHEWTVDTEPPTAIAWHTVPSPSSSNPAPTLTFGGEPGSQAFCRVDDGPWEPCASPFTVPHLRDGAHTVAVKIVDPAGNASPVVEHRWAIDTTPPPAPPVLPGPDRTTIDPNAIAEPPRGATAARTRIAAQSTVTAPGHTVRVGCTLDGGVLARCVVRIYERRSNGTRGALLGTGTVRGSGSSRTGTAVVTLNARGKRVVARTLGGRRVIVSSTATPRGATALRAKDVRTTLYPQRLLTIPTVLPFSIDRGVVTGAARRVVADVARQLRRATSVRCVGFTDSVGPAAHNRRLGLRRAQAVCRTLRQMGVKARLSAASHGEDRPRASNDTAAGRAKNRRVELAVRY